jgi:hypothetical protein
MLHERPGNDRAEQQNIEQGRRASTG